MRCENFCFSMRRCRMFCYVVFCVFLCGLSARVYVKMLKAQVDLLFVGVELWFALLFRATKAGTFRRYMTFRFSECDTCFDQVCFSCVRRGILHPNMPLFRGVSRRTKFPHINISTSQFGIVKINR